MVRYRRGNRRRELWRDTPEGLEMLDEALALHRGDAGEPVTDEDLRELGIDPDSVPDEPEKPDAPWFDENDA